MTTEKITETAKSVVASVGQTVHQGIGLYRKGGERLAIVAGKSWNTAFKQASPQLSAETRKNAAHAQQVFAGYFARGLDLSADGAVVVVDTIVGAAISAIDNAATLKRTYQQKSA